MKSRKNLLRGFVAVIGILSGIGLSMAPSCGSNDDRCTEACDMWSVCETWGASCWSPTFDACYDLCMEEDDWGPSYIRCLRRNEGACCAMEDCE